MNERMNGMSPGGTGPAQTVGLYAANSVILLLERIPQSEVYKDEEGMVRGTVPCLALMDTE